MIGSIVIQQDPHRRDNLERAERIASRTPLVFQAVNIRIDCGLGNFDHVRHLISALLISEGETLVDFICMPQQMFHIRLAKLRSERFEFHVASHSEVNTIFGFNSADEFVAPYLT